MVGSCRVGRILFVAALILIGADFFFGTRLYCHPYLEIQLQAAGPKFASETSASETTDPATDSGIVDFAGPNHLQPQPAAITLGKRTLTEALTQQGLSRKTIGRIAEALRRHLNLRRLQPEDTLQLYRDPDGTVTKMVYSRSPLDIFEVCRRESDWVSNRLEVATNRRVVLVAGALKSNLFGSIEKLGERTRLVLDFATIFAWVFDFAADSQPGDRFRILVEKIYIRDRFVDYGRILAAEYESEGTLYTAIYFEDKERGDYYTPKGESLRRAFLKSPVDFTRISSGYNRARRDPILGGLRPHLAVDYAAPIGTPVWAVADGVVKFAGRRGGFGRTITLRHKAGYQTVYSHLSRFGKGIRRGAKVLQHQVIGYVGSTGLSTGPHLDYRVIKDGRYVNPLKQKFLPGDPIPESFRPAFIATRDLYLQKLRSGLED